MILNKVELDYINNLREKGKSWQVIGVIFGMKDEAIRSLYRRWSKNTTLHEDGSEDVAAILRSIQARLDSIEATISQARSHATLQSALAMQS